MTPKQGGYFHVHHAHRCPIEWCYDWGQDAAADTLQPRDEECISLRPLRMHGIRSH